jgi:hypothetical protein
VKKVVARQQMTGTVFGPVCPGAVVGRAAGEKQSMEVGS